MTVAVMTFCYYLKNILFEGHSIPFLLVIFNVYTRAIKQVYLNCLQYIIKAGRHRSVMTW